MGSGKVDPGSEAVRISWKWLAVGAVVAIGFTLLGQPRIGHPMPPVPALSHVRVIAVVTNGEEVIEVRVKKVVPKADMPEALPVSSNAPHHYYGVAELKPTKTGVETENELFYFGLYPDEASFHKAHGVGNPKFNRRFRAVIRVTSELPNEPACVWQRRDGFNP